MPPEGPCEQLRRGKENQASHPKTTESSTHPLKGDREGEGNAEEVFAEASKDYWVFSSTPIMVIFATAGERFILKLQIQRH